MRYDARTIRALLGRKFTCSVIFTSPFVTTTPASGQPLFDAGPFCCGHASSLSGTPSPSASGHGQPWFSLGPGSIGHLSSSSGTPSLSRSGLGPARGAGGGRGGGGGAGAGRGATAAGCAGGGRGA